MKALLLTFNAGELAVNLASAMSKEADVSLLISDDLVDEFLDQLDPSVLYIPHRKPRLRQPLKQLKFVYNLWKQIRECDPDVIHIQIGHLWFNAALPFLQMYPMVITVHDPVDHVGDHSSRKIPHFIKYFGYRQGDRLIVHSREMKPMLVKAIDVPEDKIDVVSLLESGDTTLHHDIQTKENNILFFGRIWKYKGLDYLIRAEPLIRKEIPDCKIVIAGRGEDFKQYERIMENRDSFIVHNEYISSKKQARLFREASVVVLPYIEATQSGVIPAAYNFMKPVVATAVGGIPEQVDDGKTGFLIEPKSEEALAKTIIKLLKDDQLRTQMGINGKRKLETEWSADAVARQTVAVYQKAIDAKSR